MSKSKSHGKDKKKAAQLVLRVEKSERDVFVALCEKLDTTAAREIRRFMREMVAAHAEVPQTPAPEAPTPEIPAAAAEPVPEPEVVTSAAKRRKKPSAAVASEVLPDQPPEGPAEVEPEAPAETDPNPKRRKKPAL